MKYLIYTVIAILISADSYSQQINVNHKLDSGISNIRISPKLTSGIMLIEFNNSESSIVKLYIENSDKELISVLADSEMEAGQHSVYFKAPDNLESGSYNCILENYSVENSSLILAAGEQFEYKKESVQIISK